MASYPPDYMYYFEIVESRPGELGYQYVHILQGEDGSKRVWKGWEYPGARPWARPSTYQVGQKFKIRWQNWRHLYLPLSTWRTRLKNESEHRCEDHIRLWACDVCGHAVYQDARASMEQAFRDARLGMWERLNEGHGQPVMRCWNCVREHGKEEIMADVLIKCWDCQDTFPHNKHHKQLNEAIQEAQRGFWRVVVGAQALTPQLRCTFCAAKAAPGARRVFHPVVILAVAFAVFEKDRGWISEKDASDAKRGTADKVISALKGELDMPEIKQKHVDQANDALAWFLSRRGKIDARGSDYEKSVAGALWHALDHGRGVNIDGFPHITTGELIFSTGLVASGVIVYLDWIKRKGPRQSTWDSMKGSRPVPLNTWIHAKQMTVTHVEVRGERSQGYPLFDYKIRDKAGNAYKWFKTRKVLGVGATFSLNKAKVIRHEEYAGVTFNHLAAVLIHDSTIEEAA